MPSETTFFLFAGGRFRPLFCLSTLIAAQFCPTDAEEQSGINVHGLNFLKFASGTTTASAGRSYQADRRIPTSPWSSRSSRHRSRLRTLSEDVLVEPLPRFVRRVIRDHAVIEVRPLFTTSTSPSALVKTSSAPVADYGWLEHIFNITQALANVSALCKVGGQILHALPANNYCGHGFWQFSPELFFSLYSTSNGYTETRIFIADMEDESHWYEVKKPRAGQRAEVVSHVPLILLVRTKKGGAVRHDSVQQSDYSHAWEVNRPNLGTDHSLKEVIKKFRHLFILAFYLRRLWRYLFPLLSYRDVRLSPKNGSVERKTVASICCA